jgi:hypothetical protein
MRRKNLHLLLLSLLVISVSSCTEEISEKLKEAAADEASSGSEVTLKKDYFRVTSTNGEGFSHFLHLEGNSKKPCEVSKLSKNTKAEDYFKNSDLAVDCVLDVEELDLHRNGAELKFDAGAGLCEYVTYTPLRFAQFQPGQSTKTQYTVVCDSVCGELNTDFCDSYKDKNFRDYSGATSYISYLPQSSRIVSNEIVDALTCQFDYSASSGPNCDNGTITTTPLEVTSYANSWCDGGEVNLRAGSPGGRNTEGDCTTAATWNEAYCIDATYETEGPCETDTPGNWVEAVCSVGTRSQAYCEAAGSWRPLDCRLSDNIAKIVKKEKVIDSCGGNPNSCFEGPGTEFGENFVGVIWNNDSVTAFTKEVSVKAPFDLSRASNRYAASYSRACVNDSPKGAGVYASNSVPFLGHKVEELSTFSQYTAVSVDSDQNGVDDYLVYGDHPFMSVASSGSRPRYVTKPYYAINCLDQSRDVKAQIRVHIREWDRAFLNTFDFLNKVSDVDRPLELDRYIDNNATHDDDQEWNDAFDWDDFYEKVDPVSAPSGIFPNSDCRTLAPKRVPSAGECIAPFAATYFNKKDCQDNVPRCTGRPVTIIKRIDCGTCMGGSGGSTADVCVQGLGTWTLDAWNDTPWISEDNSSSNFPSFSK